MDPAMIAMILKAAGEAAPGVGAGISKIDWLSAEQKNKMKELERQQALGLLGIDKAQEQQILSQQLQPVQTAGRQLLRETQQAQSIGDVGQGAAFRQQAAQQGAMQDATIKATQAAQDQISEMDRLARAEQLAELRGYKQQRQQNIQGVTDIVSSLLGGGADVSAAIDTGQQRQIYEDSLRGETKDAQRRALKKVSPSTNKEFEDDLIDAVRAEQTTRQKRSQPTPDERAATERWLESQEWAKFIEPPPPSPPLGNDNPGYAILGEGAFETAQRPVAPDPEILSGIPTEIPTVTNPIFKPLNPTAKPEDQYGWQVMSVDPATGSPNQIQWTKGGKAVGRVRFPPFSADILKDLTKQGY
tara:strand:+ start:1225 stop:2298 length:1074 start_codon:yes stop_codon:yes gene_type:complete